MCEPCYRASNVHVPHPPLREVQRPSQRSLICAIVSEPNKGTPNSPRREVHEGPAWCFWTCTLSQSLRCARDAQPPPKEVHASQVLLDLERLGTPSLEQRGNLSVRSMLRTSLAFWRSQTDATAMLLGTSRRSCIPRNRDSEPTLPAAKGKFIWALQHPQNRLRLLSEREVRVQFAFL